MNSTTASRTAAGASGGAVVSPNATACVSQGIKIKGEVTGSEDLFIDGVVDGKITLGSSTLTVGPNATVKAEIVARELVLRGRAEGRFTASERIRIWSSARVQAELKSERISIEDGAEVHGKVEAGKAGVSASGAAGQGKKAEAGKAKETSSADEKTTGAATAGAD